MNLENGCRWNQRHTDLPIMPLPTWSTHFVPQSLQEYKDTEHSFLLCSTCGSTNRVRQSQPWNWRRTKQASSCVRQQQHAPAASFPAWGRGGRFEHRMEQMPSSNFTANETFDEVGQNPPGSVFCANATNTKRRHTSTSLLQCIQEHVLHQISVLLPACAPPRPCPFLLKVPERDRAQGILWDGSVTRV